MRSVNYIPTKIFTRETLQLQLNRWRLINKKIVFTNGVFDILHEGHIASLSDAASYGDILIVGVNADGKAIDGCKVRVQEAGPGHVGNGLVRRKREVVECLVETITAIRGFRLPAAQGRGCPLAEEDICRSG